MRGMTREEHQEWVRGMMQEEQQMRTFDTGATRNVDTDKFDFAKFLSVSVLERYARYMHSNRPQADGTLRDGDQWKLGIPQDAYLQSMCRHFIDVWKHCDGEEVAEDKQTALCALLFNVMGMLHEELKK